MSLKAIITVGRAAFCAAAAITMTACGSGGGGSTTPPVQTNLTVPPSPRPPASTIVETVSGTVNAIGPGSYGSTAAIVGPLAGATVVVGPVLVPGPTVPATLPPGDVLATTDAGGHFSLTLAIAAAAPPAQTFLLPSNNVFGLRPPNLGYFVSVLPKGSDGLSAGSHLPLRTFVALSPDGNLGSFRIAMASADEAGWLALLNRDRAAHGQPPETFDENDEEAAREHVVDMTTMEVGACHYDAQNRGPDTRYLMLGGLYADAESIGIYGGPAIQVSSYWPQLEAAFWAEGPGDPNTHGHYYQVDGRYQWAGTAVVQAPWYPNGTPETFTAGDLESTATVYSFPTAGTYGVYPGDCAPGISANGS